MTTFATTPRPRTAPAPDRRADPQRAKAPAPASLRPHQALGLAVWAGLATGLLELLGELARVLVYGREIWLGRYQLHRHYLWMVPATSLLVFGATGVLLGLVAWVWPRRAARVAALALVFLAALTLLLLFRPLLPAAGVVLAAGIAVRSAGRLEADAARVRRLVARSYVGLALVAGGLAAWSFLGEELRESRALDGRPTPPAGAPNVLLIVLDATRADALTPYGSKRDTTPNLDKLARAGITFDHARATAPWTLPSHASLFTGRWPHELKVGPGRALDGTYPTLAEYLRRRGYATAGFAANYAFCGVRYGLDRGFAHYDDRPISLDDMLACTGLGRRLMPAVERAREQWSERVLGEPWYNPVDPRYITRCRSASEIDQSFLDWLATQRGRPFFAFLNLYDAHAPYLPPKEWTKHFGEVPQTREDYEMLRNWEQDWHLWNPKRQDDLSRRPPDRDFALARDGYDDSVAYMDDQIGRLLAELDRRGVLDNTLVVVTADHGEAFGEHNLYCHYVSLHRPEIEVPLIVSMPSRLPRGVRIAEPVSLRSFPATVVDLVGFRDRSPFPGRSLARAWWPDPTRPADPLDDAVLSELEEMSVESLMVGTKVYIHHGDGVEQLFDLQHDPREDNDLMGYPGRRPEAEPFRAQLAKILSANPPRR